MRLLGADSPIRVNGALIRKTESGSALSPFLSGKELNRVEFGCEPDRSPFVEITPRVFLAEPRRSSGRATVLAVNTLENATSIVVEIGRIGRNAYLPPESEMELSFDGIGEEEAMIRMTKLPEALEGGYVFERRIERRAVPGTAER